MEGNFITDENTQLDGMPDKLKCRCDTQGKFVVKTIYKFLNFRGIQPIQH